MKCHKFKRFLGKNEIWSYLRQFLSYMYTISIIFCGYELKLIANFFGIRKSLNPPAKLQCHWRKLSLYLRKRTFEVTRKILIKKYKK